jgi:hypothetical protein
MSTGFITHPLYLSHQTGDGHPETPKRLSAILDHIERAEMAPLLQWITPKMNPEIEQMCITGMARKTVSMPTRLFFTLARTNTLFIPERVPKKNGG